MASVKQKNYGTHQNSVSKSLFLKLSGNFNADDNKSTWIFLNELNKRLELLSDTQKHMPREICNISYEIATYIKNISDNMYIKDDKFVLGNKTPKVKVKFYRYRPGVAQRLDRGIALLFHDRGTKRG